MTTLYEILGLSQRATAEQVEQAYVLQTRKLESEDQSSDGGKAQLMAIKEAYAVLSSSARRQTYDTKLNKIHQLSYEVVATSSVPWLQISLITAALLAGGLYFYKTQEAKARIEQLALAAEKAKADAETAQLKADTDQAALQKEKLLDAQHAADRQRKDSEQARLEGQQIHSMLEQQAERKARDDAQAARQAKYNQAQEEQAARNRVQMQNAAIQRAINMPIRR